MKKRLPIYLTLLALLMLYVFGANTNSSAEAWQCAANIRFGQQLFSPHHLLYNLLGYLWLQCFSWISPCDTLLLLKLMNAVFATLSLWVLAKILLNLEVRPKRIPFFLIFAGTSWAVMRYATENDAYIVPILFSLLGSLYFIKAIKKDKPKQLIVSGLFAAIACLFHQIMFFWWLALFATLIHQRNWRKTIKYLLPAIIVPIVYIIIIYIEQNNLNINTIITYIFSDYFDGKATIKVDEKAFFILETNLFLTFFQINGYIYNLLIHNIVWPIFATIGIVLLVVGAVLFFRHLPKLKKFDGIFVAHMLAFIMQAMFAGLSGGKIEFLVMVPFIFAIILSYTYRYNVASISLILSALLIWNVAFGIIPLKLWKADTAQMVYEHATSHLNECSVYVVQNKQKVQNMLYYNGLHEKVNLISPTEAIGGTLDTLLANGYTVFTDIVNRPLLTTSDYFMKLGYNPRYVLDGYNILPETSRLTLNGNMWLYKIVK